MISIIKMLGDSPEQTGLTEIENNTTVAKFIDDNVDILSYDVRFYNIRVKRGKGEERYSIPDLPLELVLEESDTLYMTHVGALKGQSPIELTYILDGKEEVAIVPSGLKIDRVVELMNPEIGDDYVTVSNSGGEWLDAKYSDKCKLEIFKSF